MAEYNFTLALNTPELSEEQVKRFYDAGPGDATLSARSGRAYAAFTRDSETFAKAVVSAIEDLERALPGIEVAEVEPEELVFASDIAERTDRTRESVRLLIEGRRGPGDFPPPAHVVGTHPIWRWSDVQRWFAQREAVAVGAGDPEVIEAINGTLCMRNAMRWLATTRSPEREVVRRFAESRRERITA